jgi:hypothetical protein
MPERAIGSLFNAPTILSEIDKQLSSSSESSTVPVGGAARRPNTPCRGVTNPYSCGSRESDGKQQYGPSRGRKVLVEAFASPVLYNEGEDDKYRY